MLQSLTIKNVALISSLTIDFGSGFNVLLGETGAGKSIIFDSLSFVLGSKADKTLIRSGEQEMKVDALFSNLNENILDSLKELGYDEEEISLSRILYQDGKSICRINGIAVTLSQLKLIGQILVDIYSQHDSFDLLKTKNHLLMIDRYAFNEINCLKENVKICYQNYRALLDKINVLGGDKYDRERTMSLLKYEVKIIDDANLSINEDVEIKAKRELLNNAEKIVQAVNVCLEALMDNNQSAINLIQFASLNLNSLLKFEKLEDIKNRLDSCIYDIEDICDYLKNLRDQMDFDEAELDQLENRYDLIKSIVNKYGSIENALKYSIDAKNRLMQLEDADYLLENLIKEKEILYNQLLEACNILSTKRKNIALEIENKITKELEDLNMKSSKFVINFNQLTNPTANGFDNVEFEFSANIGQEVKSLSKTASGGELSRFMLAIKDIFAQIGSAQTLIFDEIDAGISGETGNVVGAKLNNLTNFAQVICITHLPQVAAYGDNFYYVSKRITKDNTFTTVDYLNEKLIIYNIARLIAGDNVTEIALKHAKEMREKTGKI